MKLPAPSQRWLQRASTVIPLPERRSVSRDQRALLGHTSGLLLLGLASVFLYWRGIAAAYPLVEGLREPHTTWSSPPHATLRDGLAHALVYVLMIACYGLALHWTLRLSLPVSPSLLAIIGGAWLVSSAVLLAASPGQSHDIFDYIFRGRMLAKFGASPLAVTPDTYRDEPFYGYIGWARWVDAYGPVWEYVSGAVALSGEGTLASYVLRYRLLSVILTGLCGALIYTLVRAEAPRYAPAALLAWSWNPLLLVSTALGAHNDVLMIVFVLLEYRCFQRRKWVAGLLMLVLAAHVKMTALLLLPVMCVWLARRNGWWPAVRTMFVAFGLAAPLSWLLYQPLGGWATLPRNLRERALLLYNSPAYVTYMELQHRWTWPEIDARHATTVGANLLFLLIALVLFAYLGRRQGNAHLWGFSLAITMAYLLVGAYWFNGWYVLWALALAALLPTSGFTQTIMPAYSLGALLSNIATDFLSERLDWRQRGWVAVTMLLLPPAIVVVVRLMGRGARTGSRSVRRRP